jgi:hypothetical protein
MFRAGFTASGAAHGGQRSFRTGFTASGATHGGQWSSRATHGGFTASGAAAVGNSWIQKNPEPVRPHRFRTFL